MSQVGAVIDKVTRQLLSGTVEERNKIASALTTTTTSIVLSYDLESIRKGSVIQIGQEQMYVWAVTTASKTVEVERAFNGTDAQAHATGAIVISNPRFPRNQILEAINAELADLSSPMNGLFQIKTLELQYNGSDRMIDLMGASDIQSIYSVNYRYQSDDYPRVMGVKLLRNMPVEDFPSTFALNVEKGPGRSGKLVIRYKTGFDFVSSENEDLTLTSGLPDSCEDIVVLGAQIRVYSPREMKRNFTESQGDTRRSNEVPPGAVSSSINNLIRLRRDRITAEALRLTRQYPTLLRG